MIDIKENLSGKGWKQKMSGIDAKSPKPGMRIKGKFGVYELVKKIGSGGNGTVFAIEVISDRKGLP